MLLGIQVTVSFAFDHLGELPNWLSAALLTFSEISAYQDGVVGALGAETSLLF